MTSLVAYNNRFNDTRAARTVLADVGTTFSSDQPLDNLTRKQLSLFAQFTENCELDIQAVEDSSAEPVVADSFSADVFAVLGHTLADGMEVEFLDGATSLGSVTVANYIGVAQHAILVLDSAVSLDTLTVKVTGGTAGVSYRIGAVWAGPSFRTGFGMEDFTIDPRSLSQQSFAAATGYTNEQPSQQMISARFPGMTRANAIGPAWPNWKAIAITTGLHEPLMLIPDTSDLAHSVYGLVEAFVPARPHPSPGASLWRGGVDVIETK